MRYPPRRLVWLTLGFGLACWLSTTLLWDRMHWIFPTAAFLCAAGCGPFLKKLPPIKIMLWLLLGFGSGILWFYAVQFFYLFPLKAYDGETLPLAVTATGYSEQSRYSMSFDGKVMLSGKEYLIRVYLNEDNEVCPGDVVESSYRVRLTTPDGLKESAYYQGQKIFLIGSQKGEPIIHRQSSQNLRTVSSYVANKIKLIIMDCFAEDTAGFAKALFLGDGSSLSYEADTALKVSGIRHIAKIKYTAKRKTPRESRTFTF